MGVHRQEGKGNAVGALLGSILISGRSAVMPPGQVVTAMIKDRTHGLLRARVWTSVCVSGRLSARENESRLSGERVA